MRPQWVNTLGPRQHFSHFADDIIKWIFVNENVWILLQISLKFVLKVRINNILALVQKLAWPRPGDKPLSEPMVVSLLTHMCVTRPQWINPYCTESILGNVKNIRGVTIWLGHDTIHITIHWLWYIGITVCYDTEKQCLQIISSHSAFAFPNLFSHYRLVGYW